MGTEYGLTILRVVIGGLFIYHGWPKLRNWKETFTWLFKEKMPLPMISTIGLSIGETFGGLFLILGILTRPVALILAFIMLMATIYHLQRDHGFKMQAEVPFILFIVCMALLIMGGGALQLAP